MGRIILYVFLFVSVACVGQEDSLKLQADCFSKFDFDTTWVSGFKIRYKILVKHETADGCWAEILLPDQNPTSIELFLHDIFVHIGNLYKINEFYAFKTCIARRIYISSYPPGSPERNAVQDEIIGHFKIK